MNYIIKTNDHHLKARFTLLLFTLSLSVFGQTDLGIGLISITCDSNTFLDFYRSPTDKTPAKTVEFYNDTTIHSWSIRNFDKNKEWLLPEAM